MGSLVINILKLSAYICIYVRMYDPTCEFIVGIEAIAAVSQSSSTRGHVVETATLTDVTYA